MRVVVSHLSGAFAGKRELFEGDRLTIGRARVNVVRLGPHDTVSSSKHAELVAERDHYVLHDLGSTNGTFSNGKRIERLKLASGDTVTFGFGGPQLRFDFFEELPDVRPSLDEPHEFSFKARFAWSMLVTAGVFASSTVVFIYWESFLPVLPLALGSAALALLGVSALRKNITLGPDGIEYQGMLRTRLISWPDVAALESGRRTGMLAGQICRVKGWKGTIVFAPDSYRDGFLLARMIAEASGKEWS